MNEKNEIDDLSEDSIASSEETINEPIELAEERVETGLVDEEIEEEDEALEAEPLDKSPKKKKKKQGKWIWAALLFLLLALLLGGFLGYRKGIARRMQKQSQQEMQMIEAQLALYFGDMGNKKYENAHARLAWIKSIKPNFPGIDDMLAEASEKMGYVPTTLPDPVVGIETQEPIQVGETPTPKPTLDLAQAEALYSSIQAAIDAQDWHLAVSKILEIKETAFEYKRIMVDGYYFIALRNRGISRIWAGELEQGMYDLSVVDSLGALDNDANGVYQWAANYITATSYWDASWASAVEAFGALYEQSPYFAETGGMTVAERYRIALYQRGEEFARQEDWCTAADYYKRSIEVGLHLDIQVTATAYAEYCANPPGQETPEPTPEETPTPGGEETPEPTEETPEP